MFTGIVEGTGLCLGRTTEGSNVHFEMECAFGHELKVDQSVSHNGVCLTVTHVKGNCYGVTAIDETLQRSNLGELQAGHRVNLERCMPAHGRFDGHIVQGHVDTKGTVERIEDRDGSYLMHFRHPRGPGWITVTKGSICVNGVSLTVVDSSDDGFSVAIIPYTCEHTNLSDLKPGSSVNLEFDILGKYMEKLLRSRLHA